MCGMGSSPVILDAAIIPLIQGPKVLDIGCGFGRWGTLIRTNYWETHQPDLESQVEIEGCDGFLPNVEMARRSGHYKEVHHLLFPPLPFADNTFNTVLLADVIEHLPEKEGFKLLEEAKRIASHRVIVSTPNWCALRPAHTTMTGWNSLEAHLSHWPRPLLRRLGFKLYGAGWNPGGRYLRGILRRLRFLKTYDEVIRPTLMSLSRHTPFLSENVVGVWERR